MLIYVSNFSDLRDASLGPLQDSGDDGRGAGAGVRVQGAGVHVYTVN